MIQRVYKVKDQQQLLCSIEELKQDSAYKRAAQCLIQVYESIWDEKVILEHIHTLKEALPDAQIVGMTQTSSEIFGQLQINGLYHIYEGMTLNVMMFERPSFTVCAYELGSDAMQEAVQAFRQQLARLDDVRGIQLFLSDSFVNADDFFLLLKESGADYPYFGNVAGIDVLQIGRGEVVSYAFTDQLYRHGVVAVIFHGEKLRLYTQYMYGWHRVGKAFTVTRKLDDKHVDTLDGIPAVEFYKKYLGLKQEQVNVYNICEFPAVLMHGKRPVARIGFYNPALGAMLYDSPVREGEELWFSYGNPRDILADTRADARRLSAFSPQAVLLIPCVNRRLFFRNENKSETELYRSYFPVLAECYGGAEIFYDKDGGGILNSALLSIGMKEEDSGMSEMPPASPEALGEDDEQEMLYVPLEERLAALLKETTKDMREAIRQAQMANKAKSDFLSHMSHEIRTPINTVIGMDEMILRESDQPVIHEYAMDIYTAGNTLLSLINDILDMSKIESGKMEIIPAEYHLAGMIHDLAGMLALRAREKRLKLDVFVDEKLPSRLYGDDVRIRQILTNILTNAVKYTEKGSVCLRVEGEVQGEYANLRFEVEDTGIGIRKEDLPKLTQEFERIDEQKNRYIEGTGLGMNITMNFLKLMGSQLKVESEYGKGSKFYFTLRQKVMDKTPVGNFEDYAKQAAKDYKYDKSFTAPDAKILVVDDNRLNRKVFTSLLRQTKIQVTEADSGQACLELVSEYPYDLIFLDHMMPDMDGLETFEKMKQMKESPNENTPVYALTANAVSGAKEMYLSLGFDGFLSKPVVSAELEGVIREALPDRLLIQRSGSFKDRG